jgi:hypothetical protein
MEDIRLAVGLIGFISVAMFMLTYRLLKPKSNRVRDLFAAVVVILIAVYVRTVWGQLWIVEWIPLPSVIVLSNWFPPLLAALAAAVWLRLEPTRPTTASENESELPTAASILRRLPVMLVILVAAIYALMYFIPEEPPECKNHWEPPRPPLVWPVCLQTTPHTCSAASSATILYTLGIKTTEQEMAKLCLTKSGTTWLGLYHGVSTKLMGTRHQVKFFEGSIAELKSIAAHHPVLLCCQLDPEVALKSPQYENDGGWIPGLAHSTVYFGAYEDFHIVGDPSRGYEFWSTEDLQTLWTGSGLQIITLPGPVPQP